MENKPPWWPVQIRGWQLKDELRFHPGNLYEYIDGGAELFISFGFRELVSLTFVRTAEPDIVVDLFDMGSPRNAFAIFAHSQEKPDDTVGQGSEYLGGQLRFWKNRFYVSLLASPETAAARESIFDLAKAIATSIPEEGRLPDIVSRLPGEGLVQESIRLFFHPAWQNSFYMIDADNVFAIDEQTEAVLAKYGTPGRRLLLLLIRYQNPVQAGHVYRGLKKSFMASGDRNGCWLRPENSWAACQTRHEFILAVFRAPSRQEALNLLNRVAACLSN